MKSTGELEGFEAYITQLSNGKRFPEHKVKHYRDKKGDPFTECFLEIIDDEVFAIDVQHDERPSITSRDWVAPTWIDSRLLGGVHLYARRDGTKSHRLQHAVVNDPANPGELKRANLRFAQLVRAPIPSTIMILIYQEVAKADCHATSEPAVQTDLGTIKISLASVEFSVKSRPALGPVVLAPLGTFEECDSKCTQLQEYPSEPDSRRHYVTTPAKPMAIHTFIFKYRHRAELIKDNIIGQSSIVVHLHAATAGSGELRLPDDSDPVQEHQTNGTALTLRYKRPAARASGDASAQPCAPGSSNVITNSSTSAEPTPLTPPHTGTEPIETKQPETAHTPPRTPTKSNEGAAESARQGPGPIAGVVEAAPGDAAVTAAPLSTNAQGLNSQPGVPNVPDPQQGSETHGPLAAFSGTTATPTAGLSGQNVLGSSTTPPEAVPPTVSIPTPEPSPIASGSSSRSLEDATRAMSETSIRQPVPTPPAAAANSAGSSSGNDGQLMAGMNQIMAMLKTQGDLLQAHGNTLAALGTSSQAHGTLLQQQAEQLRQLQAQQRSRRSDGSSDRPFKKPKTEGDGGQ